MRATRWWVTAAAVVVCATGCVQQVESQPPAVDIGDAGVGRGIIEEVGCGACHRIPGVDRADGLVGPPLDAMGRRTFIAGQLANSPENMVRWLKDPDDVEPGTAMPDLNLTDRQARDISAYLASLD